MHTGFVQVTVPLHLHRRLHLHVVLEETAAERGLVVANLLVFLALALTADFKFIRVSGPILQSLMQTLRSLCKPDANLNVR